MGMRKRKQKHNYKIKQVLKTKQGATLVEMVVTFALIAIFFAGISTLLYRAMETYHQIRGLNYAEQVSDTLMDKVAGTISKANPSSPDGIEEQYTMSIYENGTVIQLYDNTSSPIAITTTHARNNVKDGSEVLSAREDYRQRENQLLLYYYKVKDYDAVDWTYDNAMYMGFHIKSLTFHQADASGVTYPENVIRIDLALESNQYDGTFTSTRYVECYNFSTDELKEKIHDDSPLVPDTPEPEPEPEPEPKPEPEGNGQVTLPDSSGGEHTFIPNRMWDDLKGKYYVSIQPGDIVSDGNSTYVWANTQGGSDTMNMSFDDFVNRNQGKLVKLENQTVLVTGDLNTNKYISKGTICTDGTNCYVAVEDLRIQPHQANKVNGNLWPWKLIAG